jgi:hypothetical protein
LAVRCQQKNGQWRHAVLVFNLTDEQLRWLLQRRYAPEKLPADTRWLAMLTTNVAGQPKQLSNFVSALATYLARDGIVVILGQI